jgi:hypothetical protein
MTDQPTQPDQPETSNEAGNPGPLPPGLGDEVPSTDPGPVEEVPDDVPEDERGDLAEEILIEPQDYTSEPLQDGPQDDFDDDDDAVQPDESQTDPSSPAAALEGSDGPVPHDDPDEPPAAS